MQNDGKKTEGMMTDTHYNSTTTLQRIRDAKPCEDGWTKLLAHLGKVRADGDPLSLATVLESNGFDDALWVLSYAMTDGRLARHFQAWCAEQVLHIFERKYPEDTRVRDQIAMLRNDTATDEERIQARNAANDAASSAVRGALHAAADSAACDAAWIAAWNAAWSAANDAAWNAAWIAARGAAKKAQEQQLRKMLGIAQ